MSFWKRDRSLSDQMKKNKIERDKIRNAKERAKVDRTISQTRTREKNGGAIVQIKLAKPADKARRKRKG
jgi:hypothetical protein